MLSGDPEYSQKRERLIKAAGEIFREKGFDRASINDFAKAIGIDRASIYYYTSGKEELFQEVVQSAVNANVAMIEEIRSSDMAPEEKIRGFIVGLMKSYEDHYPYLYVYVQENMARIATDDSEWARGMRELSGRFDAAALEIIQEGVDKRAIDTRGASPRVTALAIVGMCNWSHRWYRPTGKESAETIGHFFSELVLKGLVAS